MDTVETEPHLETLTQHVTGRLEVSGASRAAEAKMLMDAGSGIKAKSGELVEALQEQPGMKQIMLTHAFVGHARVVASLGQECDIETQSCPLHLTIETPWRPVRFTMLFIVLPGGGRYGYYRAEDAERETRHRRHGAAQGLCTEGTKGVKMVLGWSLQLVLWASPTMMLCSLRRWVSRILISFDKKAAAAFVAGGDAPGDVDDEVALTLPFQRPMTFQDSQVEMIVRACWRRLLINTAVDHGSPPKCAKMLRYIVFRTHLDVLCRALWGDPPARKSLGRAGLIQRQGWCGRSPHLNIIACSGVRQNRALTAAR